MNVDLPEPLGPMTATSSPLAMSIDTPSSARTTVSPMTYCLHSSRVRMMGVSKRGARETQKGRRGPDGVAFWALPAVVALPVMTLSPSFSAPPDTSV